VAIVPQYCSDLLMNFLPRLMNLQILLASRFVASNSQSLLLRQWALIAALFIVDSMKGSDDRWGISFFLSLAALGRLTSQNRSFCLSRSIHTDWLQKLLVTVLLQRSGSCLEKISSSDWMRMQSSWQSHALDRLGRSGSSEVMSSHAFPFRCSSCLTSAETHAQ
jgi:hypothetical protein